MSIDQEGMLWVALYGGYAVSRWNPANGELLQLIKVPAPNVTNCCFAGDELDVLVVTTARENLTEQELKLFPDSGSVFVIRSPGAEGASISV
ncbi:MAG: SMP-30/gluconolactonase/LRE family protein, partial [Pedobacter sp.]